MESDVFRGLKKRGRNLTLDPAYVDTCVLVDGFLEDPARHADAAKIAKIQEAREFFRRHDGDTLLVSPFVLAEFMAVATDPNKPFKLSADEARKKIREIVEGEHLEISVPKVDLHADPTLDLPFLNYSLKLDGQAKIDSTTAGVGIVFSKGATGRFGQAGGLKIPYDRGLRQLPCIHPRPMARSGTL